MSQAEFVKELGISLGAYKNYERGERDLPTPVLWRLYEVYGVDPLWLLSPDGGDAAPPRLRPTHDDALLEAVGLAVESAIEQRGSKITRKKKWEIIKGVYGASLREGRLKSDYVDLLIAVGGD